MPKLFTGLCFLLLISCSSKPRKILPSKEAGLKVTRLGNSGYSVKHRNYMRLNSGEKDDRQHFSFAHPDSLPPFANTFAVVINDTTSVASWVNTMTQEEKLTSEVLGESILWEKRKSENGFMVATTSLKNLKFYTTSSTDKGLDSMIALVSTLSSQ
jgi:hypothetical protein